MTIYTLIQYLFLLPLALSIAYILVFAIAGMFYKQKVFPTAVKQRKIVVLIPGYREDAVIIAAAKAALQQAYPVNCFDIVVIADSFQQKTLDQLKKIPVLLLEVNFNKSTKSKALNAAMEWLTKPYDIAVVLDADNIMAADFLYKINNAFERGCTQIQGHRIAKNVNNSWAVLDAVSEEINNHIFRKGRRALGLSSAIIGSGMAFQYEYFKAIMSSVQAVGGFDKEIELKMLKQRRKIAYLNDAYVFDEKVQAAEVFGKQRRRWLSAQLYYFRTGFLDAAVQLVTTGNVDYFDKALQFIQPPRVLLLGASFFLGIIFTLINSFLSIHYPVSICWLVLMVACSIALLLSVPRSYYSKNTLLALAKLPGGILLMLHSLLHLKGANKTFLHTQHGSTAGDSSN